MNRKDFQTFISSFDIGCKKLHNLFCYYDSQDFAFDVCFQNKFCEILGKETASKIQKVANEEYLNKFKDELFEKDIKLLTSEEDEYPEKLLKLDDYPFFLFYKGNVSLLKSAAVGIVGTRAPSTYGKIITEKFSRELTQSGLAIVSGLAYGVDSISHRTCLESKGKTIAVLGGGFDKIYPSEHTSLAKEIAEKGLLITEYPPKNIPTKYSFPQRNRIVAGLSDALLITEAGAKSGTMITLDFALDNGICVYCVPGNITSSKSEGTNQQIYRGHAQIALSAKDIIDDLGGETLSKKHVVQLNMDEQLIINALTENDETLDGLSLKTQLKIQELTSILFNLEIRGIIRLGAGGYYCVC